MVQRKSVKYPDIEHLSISWNPSILSAVLLSQFLHGYHLSALPSSRYSSGCPVKSNTSLSQQAITLMDDTSLEILEFKSSQCSGIIHTESDIGMECTNR